MSEGGDKKSVRIRDPDTNLKCTLKALDYSYGDLSRFVTYSKSKQRVCAVIPPDLHIEDLVQYLDEICSDIMVEWQSLQWNNQESVNAFYATVGSLLRVLVNVTFLFDCTKYPQHARLPGLFVNNESLNEHIVHITISWVLDLRSKDYKLNDIGATLTNLVTLLHNYVSHEFGEDRKPFCKLFLSHEKLSAFLGVTVDIVVGKVGTDPVLRSSLQHVCVEFWNAIVNWNIVDGQRFTELRSVFTTHAKLRELLELMRRRVEKKDEEAIFFLTLLFDADDFVHRFLHDFDDVTRRCMDTISAELCALLAGLDLGDDAMGLLLETLVSIASHDEGRAWLLDDYLERLLELVRLFRSKFAQIGEVGGQQGVQGEAEDAGEGDGSEFQNAKKVMGLFFRLYGALHEGEHVFLRAMAADGGGVGGDAAAAAAELRGHLEAFQNHTLLHDNDIIDQIDRERYAQLLQAIDAGLVAPEDGGQLIPARAAGRWLSAQKDTFRLPLPVAFSAECCAVFRDLQGGDGGGGGEEAGAGAPEEKLEGRAVRVKRSSRKVRAMEEEEEEEEKQSTRPTKTRRVHEKRETEKEDSPEGRSGLKREASKRRVKEKVRGEEEEDDEEGQGQGSRLGGGKSRRRGRESAADGRMAAKVKESAEVLLGLLTAELDIETIGTEGDRDKLSTANTDSPSQAKRRRTPAKKEAASPRPRRSADKSDDGGDADEEEDEGAGVSGDEQGEGAEAGKEEESSERLTAAEVLVQGMRVDSPGSERARGDDSDHLEAMGHSPNGRAVAGSAEDAAAAREAYPAVSSPEFIDPEDYDTDSNQGSILVKEERRGAHRSRLHGAEAAAGRARLRKTSAARPQPEPPHARGQAAAAAEDEEERRGSGAMAGPAAAAALMEHFSSQRGNGGEAQDNSSTAASETTIPDQATTDAAADTEALRAAAAEVQRSHPALQTDVLSWLPSALECSVLAQGLKTGREAAAAQASQATARPQGRPVGTGRPLLRDAAGKVIRHPGGARARKHAEPGDGDDAATTAGLAGGNQDQPLVIADSPEPTPEPAVRVVCLSEQEKLAAVPVTRVALADVDPAGGAADGAGGAQGESGGAPPSPSRGEGVGRKESTPRSKKAGAREGEVRKGGKDGRQEEAGKAQRGVQVPKKDEQAAAAEGEAGAAPVPSPQQVQGSGGVQLPQQAHAMALQALPLLQGGQQGGLPLVQIPHSQFAGQRAVVMQTAPAPVPAPTDAGKAVGTAAGAGGVAGAGAGARKRKSMRHVEIANLIRDLSQSALQQQLQALQQHQHHELRRAHEMGMRTTALQPLAFAGGGGIQLAGSQLIAGFPRQQMFAIAPGSVPGSLVLKQHLRPPHMHPPHQHPHPHLHHQHQQQQHQQQQQHHHHHHQQQQQQQQQHQQQQLQQRAQQAGGSEARPPQSQPQAQPQTHTQPQPQTQTQTQPHSAEGADTAPTEGAAAARAEGEASADGPHAASAAEQGPAQQQQQQQQAGEGGARVGGGPQVGGMGPMQAQHMQMFQQQQQQQHWVNLTCPVQIAPSGSAGFVTTATTGVVPVGLPPGLHAGGPQLVPSANVVRGRHFTAR